MIYHWHEIPDYTNFYDGNFNLTLNLKFYPTASWLYFGACGDSELHDKECVEG